MAEAKDTPGNDASDRDIAADRSWNPPVAEARRAPGPQARGFVLSPLGWRLGAHTTGRAALRTSPAPRPCAPAASAARSSREKSTPPVYACVGTDLLSAPDLLVECRRQVPRRDLLDGVQSDNVPDDQDGGVWQEPVPERASRVAVAPSGQDPAGLGVPMEPAALL